MNWLWRQISFVHGIVSLHRRATFFANHSLYSFHSSCPNIILLNQVARVTDWQDLPCCRQAGLCLTRASGTLPCPTPAAPLESAPPTASAPPRHRPADCSLSSGRSSWLRCSSARWTRRRGGANRLCWRWGGGKLRSVWSWRQRRRRRSDRSTKRPMHGSGGRLVVTRTEGGHRPRESSNGLLYTIGSLNAGTSYFLNVGQRLRTHRRASPREKGLRCDDVRCGWEICVMFDEGKCFGDKLRD